APGAVRLEPEVLVQALGDQGLLRVVGSRELLGREQSGGGYQGCSEGHRSARPREEVRSKERGAGDPLVRRRTCRASRIRAQGIDSCGVVATHGSVTANPGKSRWRSRSGVRRGRGSQGLGAFAKQFHVRLIPIDAISFPAGNLADDAQVSQCIEHSVYRGNREARQRRKRLRATHWRALERIENEAR